MLCIVRLSSGKGKDLPPLQLDMMMERRGFLITSHTQAHAHATATVTVALKRDAEQ